MKKIKSAALFCIELVLPLLLAAQDYTSTKEKIYIQTNHVFFKPGDVIFFKGYVVKAESQVPAVVSNVLYAELISPAGTVVQKSNFKIQDGSVEGSFDFPVSAPGGIYKIRAYTSWMQNEKESLFFVKEVTMQKVLVPRILMKLDFPEKGYGAGDEVKADFSMRSLSDQPIRNYEGKFAVSIGGEVVSQSAFKTNQDGKAVIKFNLPILLTTNDGLLNVAVEYDAYTEAISRSIPIVLNKIDLQFMPEGGTMVQGVSSYIAFKALNENGKAADIKGEIKDNNGNKVATFESYHFGMGKFLLTPEAGKIYTAVITSPSNIKGEYPLPVAVEEGVVVQYSQSNGKLIGLFTSSKPIDVKLIGTVKNSTYYSQSFSLRRGENRVEIDKSVFPAGIAQFTLYTINDLPIAERLVFLNEHKKLQVQITPDKKRYQPREKVSLTVKTLDENGKPVPSNFSLSVMDDKLWTFADDKQDHILSWLLLSSELKGKIEEPQFYFKQEEVKSVPALDLLMLTHGYRYFDYNEYVVKENKLQHLPDQDNVLSGQVVDTNGHPMAAKLFIVNTVPGGKAMQITTGNDGYYFFSDLLSGSAYYLFAQALNRKEKVEIKVLHNGLGYNMAKAKELKLQLSKPKVFDGITPIKPVSLKKATMMLDRMDILENRSNNLNEVVVTSLGVRRQQKELGFSMSRVNANDLDMAKAVNLQGVLNGRVAGLQVQTVNNGVFADTKITLRGIRSLTGNNEPLFVFNGVPMEKLDLNTINPNDIQSISILKDASATAIYGSKAANGAVIIDSKKFWKEKIQVKFGNKYYYASHRVNTAQSLYSVAKKFYVPMYTTLETEERTDFRETIYWNPIVQTGKEGTATVEFFNSDAATTFRAIAEGIGYNGKLGRAEATYSTQSALQVDAKIPPYLTVGDKALLPLVIKNNSGTDQSYTISTKAPYSFITDEVVNNIRVAADSSLQVLIPIEATAAISDTIRFTVNGGGTKETISLPVTTAGKGFPVVETFSGNKSVQHDFTISQLIPGSLKTKLKLYTSLEGQLLDGIESMLREPYGCFEQTSSSTYPNIYILKYLKESGKSNPEVEQKALGYIKRGYERLIGFETAQNGFEWFGKTPPHEALTAYGLLEFTDMQQFIEVDKKMLERTKKFLLGRRDGRGSFDIITKGYDAFASVPNKIANIYIVYALTQAGMGKEIQKEYEFAVKKALEAKDGYQLAMMAIAASNMKDANNYNLMMSELDKLADKPALGSETSVVNSRDASLRVEVKSLYALALMRSPSPAIGKIAELISGILKEKSYYGYGSTQSTVMALQAIVEYSKLAGRVADGAPVDFTVNNTSVSDTTVKAALKEGNNTFIVAYSKPDKAIPYNLEVAYQTFTPPNSAKAELQLSTVLKSNKTKVGETVRMEIAVTNLKENLQPMAIAKIGIPAGLSAQPWQLKELVEKNKAAYYEIFDNYLVFYWMGFAPGETKTISLDLKAEVPGTYKAKASNVYLYYTPEHKHWNEGAEVIIN